MGKSLIDSTRYGGVQEYVDPHAITSRDDASYCVLHASICFFILLRATLNIREGARVDEVARTDVDLSPRQDLVRTRRYTVVAGGLLRDPALHRERICSLPFVPRWFLFLVLVTIFLSQRPTGWERTRALVNPSIYEFVWATASGMAMIVWWPVIEFCWDTSARIRLWKLVFNVFYVIY